MNKNKKHSLENENKIDVYDILTIFPLFNIIFTYLDLKTINNLNISGLVKNMKTADDSYHKYINDFIAKPKILFELYRRYKRVFTKFTSRTPIVCACQCGRMDDVELFMNLYPFHKYITNRDVNGYRDDMTLKEYVNQEGRDRGGKKYTPLMAAAQYEHFQVVQYLIEQCEADPNIADSDGFNALHVAAGWNRTDTELIELLLTHMTLDRINKKNIVGSTPLDMAYKMNKSPIRQKIIDRIRSKGGKANRHDANGRYT